MARPEIKQGSANDSTALNGTANLFEPHDITRNLTVFRAELVSAEQTDWLRLFAGFSHLQAITFSSSLGFLIRLLAQFEDAEIVLGSERILTRQHALLLQTSEFVQAYGVADALADHKLLTEALARQLSQAGQALLTRVLDGSLRFRLLRDQPSHEKLYLLSGSVGHRVITGSANLSRQAFEAQQQEVYIAFDGEKAWSEFERCYQRDWRESCPIDADLLVIKNPEGEAQARTGPIDLIETPFARVIRGAPSFEKNRYGPKRPLRRYCPPRSSSSGKGDGNRGEQQKEPLVSPIPAITSRSELKCAGTRRLPSNAIIGARVRAC